VLNRKRLIVFLFIIIFAAGCNAFVVPVSFIVSGVLGNTIGANKNHSSVRQSSLAPSENTSETVEDHISGTTMSKHISGTSEDHISGAIMSDHISGTSTEHISGATMTGHVSGASIPEHLSGTVVIPDHLSGN
jgi:hypothetical protein